MKRYLPLGVLIFIALAGATALAYGSKPSMMGWMHFFMGLFFCQFALLKLFNPKGFVEGFQKYDLLAKRSIFYGYLYPWLELGLGLLYFSFYHVVMTSLLTMILMGIGAVGVIRALRQGLDVRCACMGTVLDVPLSTVTLIEDLGMGLMALLMLFLS